MLYYLSTEEREEHNDLFQAYLKKLTKRVSRWIHKGLPDQIKDEENAQILLRDMETRIEMAIMDTNENIHNPMLLCGMNKNGIIWNEFFGLPIGKKIIIVDEDGDKYDFEEFDELAGETCDLTDLDELILSDIRESQNQPESDKWRMYAPPPVKD